MDSDRPPFIATQRLFHLRQVDKSATRDEQRHWLRPETFRERHRNTGRGDQHQRSTQAETLCAGWIWNEIENRVAFLTNLKMRRLCLTVDAGVGKTMCLAQTQYLRHAKYKEHLALRINFSKLPEQADTYLDTTASPPWLVKQFLSQQKKAPESDVLQLLQRTIYRGQFSLLIDALDQSHQITDPWKKVEGLAEFLAQYPSVCCVITGRPYAIDHYWDQLFAKGSAWDFAQLDVFNQAEQRRFIGIPRHNKLEQLDADVLVVPRALEAVRLISVTELEGVRTASDIYWRSVWHTLHKAFQGQAHEVLKSNGIELTIVAALKLFALLGFEMNRLGYLDGVKPGETFREFCQAVWQDRAEQLSLEDSIISLEQFRMRLELLGRLNEVIDFAALDHEGLTQVYWRSRTLQDFFAALWATCHATERDRDWLADPKILFVRAHVETKPFYEMWRLATEMPGKSQIPSARGDLAYLRSIAVLYGARVTASKGQEKQPDVVSRLAEPIRSTEMLHRVWETVEELAQSSGQIGRLAADIRNAFLDEFAAILQCQRGRAAKRVAVDFETWFVEIPPTEELKSIPRNSFGRLEFVTEENDDPRSLEHTSFIDGPFQLAKFQLTNAVYQLFDPDHFSRHRDYMSWTLSRQNWYDRGQFLSSWLPVGIVTVPHPRCPVQFLDWYDAWCVAIWLGGRLPTEDEWEFACRASPAGVATNWCFGDEESRLKKYAWYCENSARTTHPVGTKAHNKFGLFDMHGNVWEWTASWYSADRAQQQEPAQISRSRVLRGGSFNDHPEGCRCAYRYGGRPADILRNAGVRVLRAKKS